MKGVAMSILSGTEVVLFSPMEGKITYQGKSVANAKITRLTVWKDETGETDVFNTNEKGEFDLPVKKTNLRLSPLAEFRVAQEIRIFFQDEEFLIWVKSKRNIELYGELNGKPKNLRCELTDKRERQENHNGLFSTSCKWDSIEKQGKK